MSRACVHVPPRSQIFAVDWYAWVYRWYFWRAAVVALAFPVLGAVVTWAMLGELNRKILVQTLVLPCILVFVATAVNAVLLWRRTRKISYILGTGNLVAGRVSSIHFPVHGEQAVEIITVCDIDGRQIVRKHRICSFCELGSLKVGDTVNVLTTAPTANEGLIADLFFAVQEPGNAVWPRVIDTAAQHGTRPWRRLRS